MSDRQYKYARRHHRIKDFRYTGHFHGEKSITIRCRQLSLQRKRVGIVRFAMMKEVVLDDGLIEFYRYSKTQASDKSSSDKKNTVAAIKEVLSKNSGLASNLKSITAIRIRPVTIIFFKDEKATTTISAGKGTIETGPRSFVLSSNVIVASGNRKLALDKLEIDPENELLIGENYVLNTPDGSTSGQNIKTDFNLQRVN